MLVDLLVLHNSHVHRVESTLCTRQYAFINNIFNCGPIDCFIANFSFATTDVLVRLLSPVELKVLSAINIVCPVRLTAWGHSSSPSSKVCPKATEQRIDTFDSYLHTRLLAPFVFVRPCYIWIVYRFLQLHIAVFYCRIHKAIEKPRQ